MKPLSSSSIIILAHWHIHGYSLHTYTAEITPEQNSNWVLNDIHKVLIKLHIASSSTPFFDVYLISPDSNRVAHPVSGMLAETLTLAMAVNVCVHQ